MNHQEQIIAAIEAYAQVSKLSYATIGHKVANSSSFYDRLKSGAGLTTRTYENAKKWLEANGVQFDQLDGAHADR